MIEPTNTQIDRMTAEMMGYRYFEGTDNELEVK